MVIGLETHGMVSSVTILSKGLPNPMVDKNHDEWISAQEAFDYAKPLTTRHMHKYNREQHPVMYDNYPGEISITRD